MTDNKSFQNGVQRAQQAIANKMAGVGLKVGNGDFDAIRRGREDFKKGIPYGQNPFPKNTEEAADWRLGYLEEKQKAARSSK